MITKTCDVCKEEVKDLYPLRPRHTSNGIEETCRSCYLMIESHIDALRESLDQELIEFILKLSKNG